MAEKDKDAKEATLAITARDLQDIITAAVAAAKAPNVIEQAKLDEQRAEMVQKQQYRQATAQSVRDDIENKKLIQQVCSHEHPNGASRSVYVTERTGPGYMICLKNQCKIRPEPKPAKNADSGAIYDTTMFNRLFQKANSVEEFA
jgi:hypothetical protein